MKEKMLTRDVVKAVYTVIGERQAKAVDLGYCTMNGIEFAITDRLSEDHVSYILNTYNNVLIYKRDKIQCIAVFQEV